MIGAYLVNMIEQNLDVLKLSSMSDNLDDKDAPDDADNADDAEINDNSNGLQRANSSDDEDRKSFEYTLGWNLMTLYKEILYEIIHNVGTLETNDMNQDLLFNYIKEAFQINDEMHAKCLQIVRNRKPPALLLNVEVIAAKDIEIKDSTDLTDPFVTMYLTSSKTLRFNTSVKPQTLNPIWEEKFSMPLPENYTEHQLMVEMWDFDPYEPVSDKLKKIFDRRSLKVLRKLISEIATRKNYKEFIGRAIISLNTIPPSGLIMWYSLQRKQKVKNLGSVKLKLTFSSEKDSSVSFIEYRRLLRLILRHELDTSQVAAYWWNGNFSAEAKTILEQFATQCGLSTTDITLAEWIVYSSVHTEHPISFACLDNTLGKLVKSMSNHNLNDVKIKDFWDWTSKFLPFCTKDWRLFKHKLNNGELVRKNLSEITEIFKKICSLEPVNNENDIMPLQNKRSVNGNGVILSYGVKDILQNSLEIAANDWFKDIFSYATEDLKINTDKINLLIELLDKLTNDAAQCKAEFAEIFQESKTQLDFDKITRDVYRNHLIEELNGIIPKICSDLTRLKLPDENSSILTTDQNEDEGKILFTLYKRLKNLFGENYVFHDWFMEGGCQLWFDLSTYNAMRLLKKAIELDNLCSIGEDKLFSSSSLDFLVIVDQIKLFWEQICWPNRACTCEISTKIGEIINKCLNFYTLLILEKIQNVDDIQKLCVSVDNLQNIYQNLEIQLTQFKFQGVVTEGIHSKCLESLEIEVKTFIKGQKVVKSEIVTKINDTVSKNTKKMFLEGSEKQTAIGNSFEDLMIYLESTLGILNKFLDDELFEGIFNLVWNVLLTSFGDFIQIAIENQKTPAYFKNLQIIFTTFKENFTIPSTNVDFSGIDQNLKIQSWTTTDLIHEYYKNRYAEQKNMLDRPFGELSVKCFIRRNVLEINILNGKNLKCLDKSCDSYVKVHIVPVEVFPESYKTQVQNKTEFPLYDEKFELTLTPAQQAFKDAIIVFTVKDRNLFGLATDVLGETYLNFADLVNFTDSTDISKTFCSVTQQHLPLSRHRTEQFTSYSDSGLVDGKLSSTYFIKVLELRHDDKKAKEFMRRITKT